MEEEGEREPRSDTAEPKEDQERIPLSERQKGVDFIDDTPAPVDEFRPSLDAPQDSAPDSGGDSTGSDTTDSDSPSSDPPETPSSDPPETKE